MTYPMLVVDSEDPVAPGRSPWQHLVDRDGWQRPPGVEDDQAQLMATCMETWIVADRAALREVFGARLRENALAPRHAPEGRTRQDVQAALENATRDCGPKKAYTKGKRSFQVLDKLNPATLRRHLAHFRRFMEALERHC